MDGPAWSEELGKCQSECAGARSELEPHPAGPDRVADQPDVVRVIYGAISDRVRLRA